MRGLLLIGMLIALAVVGLMAVKQMDTGPSPAARSPQKQVDAVKQEVNAAVQQRMDTLRKNDQR